MTLYYLISVIYILLSFVFALSLYNIFINKYKILNSKTLAITSSVLSKLIAIFLLSLLLALSENFFYDLRMLLSKSTYSYFQSQYLYIPDDLLPINIINTISFPFYYLFKDRFLISLLFGFIIFLYVKKDRFLELFFFVTMILLSIYTVIGLDFIKLKWFVENPLIKWITHDDNSIQILIIPFITLIEIFLLKFFYPAFQDIKLVSKKSFIIVLLLNIFLYIFDKVITKIPSPHFGSPFPILCGLDLQYVNSNMLLNQLDSFIVGLYSAGKFILAYTVVSVVICNDNFNIKNIVYNFRRINAGALIVIFSSIVMLILIYSVYQEYFSKYFFQIVNVKHLIIFKILMGFIFTTSKLIISFYTLVTVSKSKVTSLL